MTTKFSSELAVRPDDIDQFQHVHKFRYLDYIQAARYEQMVNCYKMSMKEFTDMGFGFVVKKATLNFKRALIMGDEMIVHTQVREIGATDILIDVEIFHKKKNKLVLDAEMVYTMIDLRTGWSATIRRRSSEVSDLMNFWSQFPQGQCLPSCGCEPLLNALILQPWAFWSSLAYLISGVLLYIQIEKKSFELKFWTVMMLYLTFSSMFAHASYLKLALAMDFSSIVVLISLFSFYNLLLILKQSKKKIILWSVLYISLLTAFFLHDERLGENIPVCSDIPACPGGSHERHAHGTFSGESAALLELSLDSGCFVYRFCRGYHGINL